MARSADALQRRAEKRSRTVEEQQKVDSNAAKKLKKETEKGKEVNAALTEPGAWKCPSCGNQNFASRYICNSKTCDETKPESAIRESQASRNSRSSGALGPSSWTTKFSPRPDKKPRRHDPETSKVIDWTKPQASTSQIEQNQLLRQRLRDKDPTLTGEDLERAQILVARDERKQQKKKKNQKHSSRKGSKGTESSEVDTADDKDASKTNDDDDDDDGKNCNLPPKLSKKEQQKANRKLLKQLEDTQGKGMTESEVTRAKELLARKTNKSLIKTFEKTGGKGMSEEEATRAQNLLSRKERKHQRRVREGKTRKQ